VVISILLLNCVKQLYQKLNAKKLISIVKKEMKSNKMREKIVSLRYGAFMRTNPKIVIRP
jgi:hypothetical protein